MRLVRIVDLSRFAYQVPKGWWGAWWIRRAFQGGSVEAVNDYWAKHIERSVVHILQPDPGGPDVLGRNGKRFRGRFRAVRVGWVLKDLGPHHGQARCADLVCRHHQRMARRARA